MSGFKDLSKNLISDVARVMAEAKKAKLDPVGKEDSDIDNDGDSDKSDSYLAKRRKAIAAAIQKEEAALDEGSSVTVPVGAAKPFKTPAPIAAPKSVPPRQPMQFNKPAPRAQTTAPKPNSAMRNEPITGGPNTVPMTPERQDFLRRLNAQNARARMNPIREGKMDGVAKGSMEDGKHMCATKVFHKEWAEGTPVKTMHADPDENGNIEWYDVMFEHGIERVMTEEMDILQMESHMHSKKMEEEVEQIDELSVVGLDKYHAKAYQSMFDKNSDKKTVAKRKKGMDMAYNKAGFGKAKVYASEEVEQIDEVSKKKAEKYIDAAMDTNSEKSVSNLASKGGFEQGERGDEDPSAGEKEDAKSVKRSKMVMLAAKKLSGSAKVPATNEEKDIDPDLEDELKATRQTKKSIEDARKKMSCSEETELEESNSEERQKIEVTPRNKFQSLANVARNVMTRQQAIQKQVIDEAKRGRPKKNAEPEEKEETKALGAQLRKAASMNKPVTFDNGESAEVHPRHVELFNDHMAARRTTQEKAAFQKMASASHEAFKKAVTAAVPSASKDTGEIVKYGK